MKWINIWKHFKTITEHKILVMKYCFRIGLYRQGIVHDMSKYSPEEFWVGVRFYQGNRSPNVAEREVYGYSRAWLHHKGRNKHHFEYWIDFSVDKKGLAGNKMPVRYMAEMMMDRIAASRVYKGKDYTDSSPLEYYQREKQFIVMHPESKALLEHFLELLSREGETELFREIRELLKKGEY